MKQHHDLEDDGDEIPPPLPAATLPILAPQETPSQGELGVLWHWLSELNWPDNPPPRRWLLRRPADPQETSALEQGFLPLGKVGMLAAGGGAGKTMALAQLAVSVVTGHPWLGHYTVPTESRGSVLLALAEEDAAEVQRRLFEIRRGLGLSAEEWANATRKLLVLPLAGQPVQLIAANEGGKPQVTPLFRELRQRLEEAGVDWKLLVLDPLSRWGGPETETDNFAATQFIAAVESLTQVRGTPTVLLAHHTTKAARLGASPNEATAARGASALTDGVRWVANLLKNDASLALSLVKTNYTAPAADCPLKREEGGLFRALTHAEREAAHRRAGEAASKKNGPRSKPAGSREREGSQDVEDYG